MSDTHKIKDKEYKAQRAKSRRAQLRQAHKATLIWSKMYDNSVKHNDYLYEELIAVRDKEMLVLNKEEAKANKTILLQVLLAISLLVNALGIIIL